MSRVTVKEKEIELTTLDIGSGWKTILFNCDCHEFEEVIIQIMKATRCSSTRASQLTSEVHHLGQATICEGGHACCEKVADVLGATGLRVSVNQ